MSWREQIDAAMDGELSEEEWEAFRERYFADETVREGYVDAAWLHGQLCAERSRLTRLLQDELPEGRAAVFPWPQLGWAVAAVFAVSLVFPGGRGAVVGDDSVAVLVEAEGCRWAGSELPTNAGASLGTGRLALVEGIAKLRFRSGAEVTLEAPSTLDVLSAMRCRLVEGSLVAEVPESAHGFTIDAPELEVVDLGTRFGVTASPLGASQVVVFEGEVEVGRRGEEKRRLTTGKSMHIGLTPPAAGDELEREPQPSARGDGVVVLSTAAGRGGDAYVRKGNAHGSTGAQPLLMVKETELVESNRRRAYVAFDLASVNGMEVTAAELSLEVCHSGLGFSALVPDSTFAVYGLREGEWTEESLRWEKAPGTTDGELDLEKLERLGAFEIRRGSAAGLVKVSSGELLAFLRKREGGVATMVLVRETGEWDPQGLVHAFASKEHPSAQAPSLRLQTTP